jgi:hypothetical protein
LGEKGAKCEQGEQEEQEEQEKLQVVSFGVCYSVFHVREVM